MYAELAARMLGIRSGFITGQAHFPEGFPDGIAASVETCGQGIQRKAGVGLEFAAKRFPIERKAGIAGRLGEAGMLDPIVDGSSRELVVAGGFLDGMATFDVGQGFGAQFGAMDRHKLCRHAPVITSRTYQRILRVFVQTSSRASGQGIDKGGIAKSVPNPALRAIVKHKGASSVLPLPAAKSLLKNLKR